MSTQKYTVKPDEELSANPKLLPYFVYEVDKDWLQNTRHKVKNIDIEKARISEPLYKTKPVSDPQHLIDIGNLLKTVAYKETKLGNYIIDQILELEEHPNIQSARLFGAQLVFETSPEGYPSYVRINLRNDKKYLVRIELLPHGEY